MLARYLFRFEGLKRVRFLFVCLQTGNVLRSSLEESGTFAYEIVTFCGCSSVIHWLFMVIAPDSWLLSVAAGCSPIVSPPWQRILEKLQSHLVRTLSHRFRFDFLSLPLILQVCMAWHSNVTRDGDLPPGHGFLLHSLSVGERTRAHQCPVGDGVELETNHCIKKSGQFADHLTTKLSFLHPRPYGRWKYSENLQVILRFWESPPMEIHYPRTFIL